MRSLRRPDGLTLPPEAEAYVAMLESLVRGDGIISPRIGVGEQLESLYPTVVLLVALRDEARKARQFGRADAIKEALLNIRIGGVVTHRIALMDSPTGTDWQWATGFAN